MLDATRDRAAHAGMRVGRAARVLGALAIAMAVTGVGCSKRGKAADACVDIAGAACQQCRSTAKHRFCDAKLIAPQASDKSTANGQKGCCGFNDPKLRAQCENILRCIRKTGCAAGNNPGPLPVWQRRSNDLRTERQVAHRGLCCGVPGRDR